MGVAGDEPKHPKAGKRGKGQAWKEDWCSKVGKSASKARRAPTPQNAARGKLERKSRNLEAGKRGKGIGVEKLVENSRRGAVNGGSMANGDVNARYLS